jgi:protein-S-isoprenylcysteine O-methyltransferase Ste14
VFVQIIHAGHTLVTNRVYGVIRHPSYLGLLVNSLGWGLPFDRESACCSRRSGIAVGTVCADQCPAGC